MNFEQNRAKTSSRLLTNDQERNLENSRQHLSSTSISHHSIPDDLADESKRATLWMGALEEIKKKEKSPCLN
jgi:hypothetical protein